MDAWFAAQHFILALICAICLVGNCERCGPLGFHAESLLAPSYWYFDLTKEHCPPNPSAMANSVVVDNTTAFCRIYMRPCENMDYQCKGTVCGRFLNTVDDMIVLGRGVIDPFTEAKDGFHVSYNGENLPCPKRLKPSTVNIKFMCGNTTWIDNTTSVHGQSLAPDPVSASFDSSKCHYNIVFNYSGACLQLPPGEVPSSNISMGSIALILFFPGLALYFIVGILVNRMRGRTGKESIPHHKFWLDFPELIMDGFVFTMSFLTCRQEDGKMNYDTM